MVGTRGKSTGLGARICLAVVLVWWAVLPAGAQAAVDPQAREYAFALYGVYQQSSYSGDWNPFFQACSRDPVMTRKSFISTLLYAAEQVNTSPVDAQNAILFANALAQTLGQIGDPAPSAIMQAIAAGYPQDQLLQMVSAYATPLYPQFTAVQPGVSPSTTPATAPKEYDPATFKYGDNPERVSQLPPAVWALLKPIYTKIARIDMAISFSNPELSIQELDGFAQVAKSARATAMGMGAVDNAASRATFAEFVAVADAPKLVILTELGLHSEFDTRLEATLANEKDTNKHAGLLLAGAGQALQRGDKARARQLMARIRPIVGNSYVPPALEYGMRTTEYRIARLEGPAPTLAQVSREFEKAWAAVEKFRPFLIVADDQYWYYARQSTRFWLREITAFPGGEKEALRIMGPTLAAWAESGGNSNLIRPGMTPDDYTLQAGEITSTVGVTLAILDQSLALLETFPEPPGKAELQALESSIEEVVKIPNLMGWDTVGPGFPAYRLDQGGLYSELLGRIRYLHAKSPTLPPEKAVANLGEALSLVKSSGFPDTALDLMVEGGLLYQRLGRSDLALQAWKDALTLADSLAYSERSAEAAALLAQEYGRLEKWPEAAAYADQASTKVEESVAAVGAGANAKKLSQTSQQAIVVSVKAALHANDPEKALAALVKGKEAETASAQMRGQKERQVEVVAVEQQKQEVAALTERVQELQAMPAGEARNSLLQTAQELLAETRADFLLKGRQLRAKYPELYSRVLKFDPLDLPDVQKTLPADAAVIQYFSTEDTLYIFLVTREAFRLRSVSITEHELDRAVTSYVRNIRRAQIGDKKLQEESKFLYNTLIAPCQEDIADKAILVLIPTGHLNILPFACLTGPTAAPLIESKLVLALAKPTDFLRISETQPKKVQSVVAFANATGDLPAAGKEGDQIAAMFPGAKLFKGKEASKQNFLDFGAGAQVLHLATHGESNSENSLTNYLKMSGNEKIAQEEILSMALDNTSIVTLSACNTAIGDNMSSKFVASLAEAFWLGGSQSVIASLWAVNDDSTGQLMTVMYEGLRDGKSKALALRDAQLKVMKTPGYEHPYYWAGFLLFGDWR